jgi:thioredoxin reductase (NADPH)
LILGVPDIDARHRPAIETDAVIIGAGPIGLFQAFQLGLLEIGCHIVDALDAPGGQCAELYGDKPIYDIPAVLECTGRGLVDRLLRQVAPFSPGFHLGQEVTGLLRQTDGRFIVETGIGQRFMARTVFIAAGVGAFRPRELKVDGAQRHAGTQVFYRTVDPSATAAQHVAIVGDGDDALDWATRLANATVNRPASVTLIHRRDHFSATPDCIAQMRAACAAGRMRFVAGQITGLIEEGARLTGLGLISPDSQALRIAADRLHAFLGLSPKLGPIADWGLALERKQVVVDTEKFETSEPGIFAVGDINTYPGKRKLIVCGFHEATLAAYGACAHVFPGRPVHLQYTTTSPRLHALLGVGSRLADGTAGAEPRQA